MNNLKQAQTVCIEDMFALFELADKYLLGQLKQYWQGELLLIVQGFETQEFKPSNLHASHAARDRLTEFVKGCYSCEIPAGEILKNRFIDMVLRGSSDVGHGKKCKMVHYERAIRAIPKAGLDILTAFSQKPAGKIVKVLLENPASLKMLTEDMDFLLKTLDAMRT